MLFLKKVSSSLKRGNVECSRRQREGFMWSDGIESNAREDKMRGETRGHLQLPYRASAASDPNSGIPLFFNGAMRTRL